nr:immunoglobulin heavy chain junction region [Macaca mulatta]MOV50526.1 immunoglobulin heavy chain junction region [Macaca mulatta]MOV52762.1 immunoglobulin heavy chain junction region [Macaca mulatta]
CARSPGYCSGTTCYVSYNRFDVW